VKEAKTSMPDTEHIVVFNDPESKVRYLETVLDGKAWRTQILFPKDEPSANGTLAETLDMLKGRGYHVVHSRNEDGHDILDVIHHGRGTKVQELLKDRGFISGVGYSIAHPGIPLNQLMRNSRSVLDNMGNYFKNPASASGLIFVIAEAFLTVSGGGNHTAHGPKETYFQRLKKPRNLLQSISGALFLSQSIIYTLFAKKPEQQAIAHLNKKTDALEKQDHQELSITFDAEKDAEKNTPSAKFGRFLQSKPVQIGAIFNDVGMLVYAGHAILNRKFQLKQMNKTIPDIAKTLGKPMAQIEHAAAEIASVRKNTGFFKSKAANQAGKAKIDALKKADMDIFNLGTDLADAKNYTQGGLWKSGFSKDIAGAATSFVGWSLLLLPSKRKTEAEKQADKEAMKEKGFFGKIAQKLKNDPETATGVMAAAASTQRFFGALSKRNYLQMIGEGIYIPGDTLLMFTKNSEYGGGRANTEKLSKDIAADLNSQSWILAPDAQRKLAHDTAVFIRDKALADAQYVKAEDQLTPEELAEQTLKLESAVLRQVAYVQGERMQHLVDASASLIRRLPEPLREQATEHMIHSLESQHWLHATHEELRNALMLELHAPAPETPTIGHIKELTEEVKTLIAKAPAKQQSRFAVSLTDMLSEIGSAPNTVSAPIAENAPAPSVLIADTASLDSTPNVRVRAAGLQKDGIVQQPSSEICPANACC
jgi:hypothetical protein